jgi:hypothetical protein
VKKKLRSAGAARCERGKDVQRDQRTIFEQDQHACRRIYSVTSIGVGGRKVPGDSVDEFGLNSASATLARNDLKRNDKRMMSSISLKP